MNASPASLVSNRLRSVCVGLLVFGVANGVRVPKLVAATPGEAMEWKVSENPPVAIRFRHCPGGTIRPGKPSPATATASDPSSVVTIREFDIGETEITIAQFRAVLGEAGLDPLKRQAEQDQKVLPELLQMLETGGEEPAFYVGIENAVDFCNALQSGFDAIRGKAQLTVETRLFRLPSHVEWQYAARAIPETDRQAASPHFGRWVQLTELSAANQQKCSEVWQSLGNAGQFPGTQDAFVELARTTDSAQLEKVRDILTECFQKAFASSPRSASGLGKLEPVGGTHPNAWNLKEFHEGVSEWAIWAAKQDRARDLWSKLATARKGMKSLDGQQDLFLCGGSFVDSYYRSSAINRFTAWGGPKLTENLPQPFEFQPDQISDYKPGFRVLSERMLAEDWMFVLRRGVFRGASFEATAIDHLRTNLAAIEELTESDHAARAAANFYLQLVNSQAAGISQLAAIPDEIVKMKSSSVQRSSAASKVAELLKKREGTPNSGEETATGDDGEYFQSLDTVLRALAKQ